jgi:hypothetical protein
VRHAAFASVSLEELTHGLHEFLIKLDTSGFHSHLQTPLHTFRGASVSCRKSCPTDEFHKVAMSITGCKVRADNFLPQNKPDPLYKGVVVSAAAWLARAMRGRWEADRGPVGSRAPPWAEYTPPGLAGLSGSR